MLTQKEIDRTEPDFEAVKAIAAAYFGIHVGDFFALPRADIEAIARLAGVTPERWPGFCKAIMSMHHLPKDCPLVN